MNLPTTPDGPKKPDQCEALRSGKCCPNEARCFWPDFNRWVCTTHRLASVLNIQFVERLPPVPMP